MVLKCEAAAICRIINTFFEMFSKKAIYSHKAKASSAGSSLVKFFRMFLVFVCSYNVDTCNVKFLTTILVSNSMAVVLYQSTSILYVFMVLPGKTWAEDRKMSTQVKLQQDERLGSTCSR